MTETKNISDFCKEHKITASARSVDSNPDMDDTKYPMDHWRVTLRRAGHSLTVSFSMGQAHNGIRPTADEVLNCLVSDARASETTFADFCSEFGYDEDSRKAERTYKACRRIGAKLAKFLGSLLTEANACEGL